MFTHEGYGGRTLVQRRPDNPEPGASKYVTEAGEALLLPVPPGMRDRVADPRQTLVIVEGSKGHLAAASWAPEGYAVVGILGCWGFRVGETGGVVSDLYEIPLSGRDVVVMLDADVSTNPNVYAAARDLSDRLTAARGARSVKFAKVPGGGTASIDDYLATVPEAHRTEDLLGLLRSADRLPARPPARARRIDTSKYEIGQDSQGLPFIVPKDLPNVALYEDQAKRWLAATAEVYGTAAEEWWASVWGKTSALPKQDLPARVAHQSGTVYVDLGTPEGQALEVTGSGWRLLDRSLVTFTRAEISEPLPIPAPGSATWADLWAVVNVAPEYRDLCRGWLVSAAHSGAATPVLLMAGAQGAAKTTGMTFLGNLVDPVSTRGAREPKDISAWAALSTKSRIVRVDNVSRVQTWWADALCTTVTGGVEATRALYSNAGLHVARLYAAVILNGITLAGITRADLAERTVALEMQKPDVYRTEEDVAEAYESLRPGLLALILDDLVAVLADTEPTPEAGGLRMASFAALLARLDRQQGTQALCQYREVMARHEDEALEADGFASAILRLVERAPGGKWSGTYGDLLGAVASIRQELHTEHRHNYRSDWPESGTAASVWLTRREGLLWNVARIRVTKTRARVAGGKVRRVVRLESVNAAESESVHTSVHTEAGSVHPAGPDGPAEGGIVHIVHTSFTPERPDSPTKQGSVNDVNDVNALLLEMEDKVETDPSEGLDESREFVGVHSVHIVHIGPECDLCGGSPASPWSDGTADWTLCETCLGVASRAV